MAKSIDIFDLIGNKTGEYSLSNSSFLVEKISNQAIFDEILAQNAGLRQGTHSTLKKGEVRGGGRKPRAQKHTGRARQGSTRNPQFVGGGICFGPKPNRNYKLKVNKKVAILAKKSAFSLKVKNNDILVIKDDLTNKKTKNFVNFIKQLKIINQRLLFVVCDNDAIAIKAIRNINKVEAKKWNQVSVADITKARKLIFCIHALDAFLGGNK